MQELRVLVGLPASGKSTYSEVLKRKGYDVISSDEFRAENSTLANYELFYLIEVKLRESLLKGNNCVLDDLNLERKKRRGTISNLKNSYKRITCSDLRVVCDLFVVNPELCKERNKNRKDDRGVTDEAIDEKLARFQCPWYSDGFDEIEVHAVAQDDMGYDREMFDDFNQENSHHTLTLGGHWKKAYEIIKQKYAFYENYPFLLEAIKYHDDGKFFTKEFRDTFGNLTEIAHYYRHENISAYLFSIRAFCTGQFEKEGEYPLTKWGKLYVANLINWHMRPFEWSKYPNLVEKDEKLLGKEMIDDLKKLNEADKLAK